MARPTTKRVRHAYKFLSNGLITSYYSLSHPLSRSTKEGRLRFRA